jgi:hypothetical protein
MTDDAGEWVRVADAAARLRTTATAIRSRIQRGTLRTRRDNHRRLFVFVTTDERRQITDAVTGETTMHRGVERKPVDETAAVRVAVLEAELRHAVEQRDQARDQVVVVTAQAQELERRLDDAVVRERELVDRLHEVEGTLRRELQRPWWRRLLGT